MPVADPLVRRARIADLSEIEHRILCDILVAAQNTAQGVCGWSKRAPLFLTLAEKIKTAQWIVVQPDEVA